MLRVQWQAIRPAGASMRRAAPWGTSKRGADLGFYPRTMLIGQGQIDISQQMQTGGVVQTPTLVPIQVQEIVRCTVLAIRRRTKLLGPLASRDPLFKDLAAAFSRRIGPPNHWSEAWTGVELGAAMAAAGQEGQAVLYLQRSVAAAGQYNHPLTSVALFELGRLAMIRGDFPKALGFFEEASYSAVAYLDPGVLEEAFRYGAMAHLMANRKGLFPPLLAAIQWAKVNRLRQLWASLLLLAAENYAVLERTGDAASMLDEARTAINRRSMADGRIGARRSFLHGLVCFQEKKVSEGELAVRDAMNYMLRGSHWLFQISLADDMVLTTPPPAPPWTSTRTSFAIRRRPIGAPIRWSRWPCWPRRIPCRTSIGSKWPWRGRTTRRPSRSATACGGTASSPRCRGRWAARLLSLRWVLEAPDESLDAQSQLHRDDLLRRYPAYEQLHRRAAALRVKLAALPLVSDNREVLRQQSEGLAQLAAMSQRQEVILREMAVRREAAALVFPPLRTTTDIQKSLPKGQALLIFVAANRSLYGFLLNHDKYGLWQLGQPTVLSRQLVALLHNLGNYQQNGELKLKDLEDKKWKQAGRDLLNAILKGSHADFGESFDELTVVPDGPLWYLPFEALEVKVKGESQPLIAHVRVRYAPTASLAIPWDKRLGRGAMDSTAVVLGRLFPRENERCRPGGDEATDRGVAGLRRAAFAAAGAGGGVRLAAAKTDRVGRLQLRPGDRSLQLVAFAAGPRQGRRHVGRMDAPPLESPGPAHPSRLAHRRRGRHEACGQVAAGGQRGLSLRVRLAWQRRADRVVEPVEDRRTDQLRSSSRVRPGVAAHRAGRRLAAGGFRRLGLAAEPRSRAAAEEGDRRGPAQGQPSLLLERLHAHRFRRRFAPGASRAESRAAEGQAGRSPAGEAKSAGQTKSAER